MIFDNHYDQYAVQITPDNAVDTVRFHLLTCSITEVFDHFTATFQKYQALTACGYSEEKTTPFKKALLEILLELRVRGYESDYSGNIYPQSILIPVPKDFPSARARQIKRLKNMDKNFFTDLYNKTIQKVQAKARQESKNIS